MLSDESSSESETGRFKDRSSKIEDLKNSSRKEATHKPSGRGRPFENDRQRDFGRKINERERYESRSRKRQRFLRHPIRRYSKGSRERIPRKQSRERTPHRKSRDRLQHVKSRSKPRSTSRDKPKPSSSRLNKSPGKESREKEIRKEEKAQLISSKSKHEDKFNRRSRDESSSPEYRGKKSVIHKPEPTEQGKKKRDSPILIVDHRSSDEVEVQPGSYYSMIPAVIKDKPEEDLPVKQKTDESSEIDSSDDEKLRAKLLNLEKELHKTKKKKYKKKHRRKASKCIKDCESSAVEVSSTTDIDKTVSHPHIEVVEVTSTQKSSQKESSEEGEITSGDDSEDQIAIDPTDLRHKLKRSKQNSNKTQSVSRDTICGPSLPPHLEKKIERKKKSSDNIEGPVLPPHLQKHRNIGPSIPDDMRQVIAESRRYIECESSDEDVGIGPLPVGTETKWTDAHQRLEERALNMKIRKLEGHLGEQTNVKSREQWMLELPEAKAKYLGLEARTFRAKAGPDMSDRSSWTDTPEEKARKTAGITKQEDPGVTLQREARSRHIASRDEDQERAVKKHKKKHKREESLLELHEKKLKKKQKKEEKEEKKERRPFSRDVDLQVNRFDEAQKKSIIKKAQALDSRFSRGEAKYL